MGKLAKVITAQEYFETWIPRLPSGQAESFRNIKNACDVFEKYFSNKTINPPSIGSYCQDPETGDGTVPPAESTIRNMKITLEGQSEHVYREYIRKRERERTKPNERGGTTKKKEEAPSYQELAMQIEDSLTRGWVLELVQRWTQAEGSCTWMEKQLHKKSKMDGGLDLAAAITEGPDENMRLPMIPSEQPSAIEFTNDLREALEKIMSIPDDARLPYLVLNDKGALVYDDTVTGAVIILSPKKWQAILEAVEGGE